MIKFNSWTVFWLFQVLFFFPNFQVQGIFTEHEQKHACDCNVSDRERRHESTAIILIHFIASLPEKHYLSHFLLLLSFIDGFQHLYVIDSGIKRNWNMFDANRSEMKNVWGKNVKYLITDYYRGQKIPSPLSISVFLP